MEFRYKAPRANFKSEPVAFIRFEARPSIDFKLALENAVAAYVVETEDGRQLYQHSSHDLNIGDLLNCGAFTNDRFRQHLRAEGIFNLDVWTPETIFNYDMALGGKIPVSETGA